MTSRRERILSACAGLALLCVASACATPYDPYRVPSAELRTRVRTIAMAPLTTHPRAADLATARTRLEPLVKQRLERGGFRVVGAEIWDQLWRAAAADVGEVYDPVTGERDDARFEAVDAAVRHELVSTHRADAVLRLHVDTVELYLTGDEVMFCGTTGPVYWPGSALGVFEATNLVVASCLNVLLQDFERQELYSIRSGLSVIETYARHTLAIEPMEERLRNPHRLGNAVEATIGPLADGGAER